MVEEKKPKTEEKNVTKTSTKPKPKTSSKTKPKKTPSKKPDVKKETAKKKTPAKKKQIEKKPEKPKTEPKISPKKTDEKAKLEEEKKEEEIKEEQKYKVKKKPEISKEIKQSLKIRKKIKKRTPEFLREEWFRYKRLSKSWRRPDGISSKMRINLKYRPGKVRVGYRGPKQVRGFHSSGFEEIIVYNINDLEKVNPKTQAARIGSNVGTKKRLDIEKKAEELEIRILNL
ncbi:MAG: 50S ribosomal protein L32e [Thermoplasmatales archaeon]|nr:MAG: 50S ribosomal protein L32e [Thermoplasmatales archaeon]